MQYILSAIVIDLNPASTVGTFSFGGVSGVTVSATGADKGPDRVAAIATAVNASSSTGDSNMVSYRAADLGGGYLLLSVKQLPTKVPDYTLKTNVSSLTIGGMVGTWIGASIIDMAYDPDAIKTGIALGLTAAKMARSA